MKTLFIVLFIICSYLLGSVPFGFILARAVGVDIKKRGSGNIGATNVFRSVSKKLGIFVFILDVLKGLVPVCISRYAFGSFECLPLVCGAVAIAGHNWP
ncbi:MAG: glycerol-3-phosphate acyltransferase, partial [Lentisphaerae bacterium]|nr:glycerol-3-phosphate acyltransferase [Lentisphaerota bacterium]